jgi:hypothetical protein
MAPVLEGKSIGSDQIRGNVLTLGIPLKERLGGERQGDFMDSFNVESKALLSGNYCVSTEGGA